jgi:hypothetical protein
MSFKNKGPWGGNGPWESSRSPWGVSSQVFSGIPASESEALVAFYTATGGDSWTDNTGWSGGAADDALGVTVVGGHVTAIELPNNNLDGDAGTTLDPLAAALAVLDLGQNPALDDIDVSALTALADIDFAGCDFGSSVVAGILANVVTAGVSAGTLDIGGSNSSPLPAGVTSLQTLEDDSWTLTYSTVVRENTGSFYVVTKGGEAKFRSSATDLSSQIGKYIVLKDSAGKYAEAYIDAADSAEASTLLFSDDMTIDNTGNWYTNDCTLTFDTDHYVVTYVNLTQSIIFQNAYNQEEGFLYKAVFDARNGASIINTAFWTDYFSGRFAQVEGITNTLFTSISSDSTSRYQLQSLLNSGSYLVYGVWLYKYTHLGTDAVVLESTLGGNNGTFTDIESGFNPNNIVLVEVFNP